MPNVEDDASVRASEYLRPLRYTFRRSASGGRGGFQWVFDEGSLQCTAGADAGQSFCLASPRERSSFTRDHPSFVYLDCGAWVDDADGRGTRRRDFGLICGPHVYLCKYSGDNAAPSSGVSHVQSFFRGMATQGRGVRVVKYARMREPLAPATRTDNNLYLFIADFHLPPVSWFYTTADLVGVSTGSSRTPPAWLLSSPAMRRQRNFRYRNYYSCAQYGREHRRQLSHASDIFANSGGDLVAFLDGLCGLTTDIKSRLHFINLGDMLEMWLGREYQYIPDRTTPRFRSANSVNLVSDWGLEVLIQNTPVFEAFRRLGSAGLREIKFLWGNHDAYTMSRSVTAQLTLPQRDPTYTGLNGDIYAEHGHRFDRSNFDNIEYRHVLGGTLSGPRMANLAYHVPVARAAEPIARAAAGAFHPSMRDCHIMGASLIHMFMRYDLGTNPFSVYVMGHTHRRELLTFNIRAEYSLYAVAQ